MKMVYAVSIAVTDQGSETPIKKVENALRNIRR